jgi:hypothetical protein
MFAPVYYLMFVFIYSRVSGYDVKKMWSISGTWVGDGKQSVFYVLIEYSDV